MQVLNNFGHKIYARKSYWGLDVRRALYQKGTEAKDVRSFDCTIEKIPASIYSNVEVNGR